MIVLFLSAENGFNFTASFLIISCNLIMSPCIVQTFPIFFLNFLMKIVEQYGIIKSEQIRKLTNINAHEYHGSRLWTKEETTKK